MSRELVNLSQAAQRIGRPRSTISSWVRRELLFPAGLEHDGTPLYDLTHVRELSKRSALRRGRRRHAEPGG